MFLFQLYGAPKLSKIPEEAFLASGETTENATAAVKLDKINLFSNNISQISDTITKMWTAVTYLSIRENPLRTLPDISHMQVLEYLSVPYFHPTAMLPSMPTVQTLEIQQLSGADGITESPITPAGISSFTSINKIDIENSRLRTLSDLSPYLPTGHSIVLDLTHNDFYCDHRICWLKKLATTNPNVNLQLDSKPCLTPANLATKVWSSISLDEMGCPGRYHCCS